MESLRGLEAEAFYEPAWREAEVGGDFYDAFPVDGGRTALVVGDASGKGIDAAARTVAVKYATRAYMNQHSSPAHALTLINQFICEKQQASSEGSEAFVTLAIVVIDSVSGELYVSTAGAEPLLLLRKQTGQSYRAERLETSRMPLGIDPSAEYDMTPVRMGARDTLLLTTDGITEARHGRELLGHEGLMHFAEKFAATSPSGGFVSNPLLCLPWERELSRRRGSSAEVASAMMFAYCSPE